MRLVEPSFEILEQAPGIPGIKKQIEIAGRTCYKSEDKITDTSCEEFVDRMVNSGHGTMLEHGTVYLYIKYGSPLDNDNEYFKLVDIAIKYKKNKYSIVNTKVENTYWHHCWITTNYRVLVENEWLDDLQYQCEPTEYHEKRVTVKFICDRGVSHEFVRHRVSSYAQESTRYCNYLKEKFGMSVTFTQPDWIKTEDQSEFEEDCKAMEAIYFKWLNKGYKAQEARYFLATGVKTELVVTAFISDWEHFFKLRCHSTAHPDARALAIPLKDKFIELKYINDDSIS